MSLFLSTFINKIDKKGRISVPATFRATLSKESFTGVVLFRSFKFKAIEGCGINWMIKLSERVDEIGIFSDKKDDLSTTIFADAHQLLFDTEGRIVLPEKLINHANLKQKAAFVGNGNTFQIWNPTDFEDFQKHARKRVFEEHLVKINDGR